MTSTPKKLILATQVADISFSPSGIKIHGDDLDAFSKNINSVEVDIGEKLEFSADKKVVFSELYNEIVFCFGHINGEPVQRV